MGNTLIAFKDKYFEYDASNNVNKRGLTIGGYESAWRADLVASFILDKTKYLFKKNYASLWYI